MNFASYSIFVLGVALEWVLVWRIIRNKLYQHYPYFCIYVFYVCTTSLGVFAVMRYWRTAYGVAYWGNEIIALLLWPLVTWEVIRQAFASRPAVFKIALRGLLVFLCVSLAAFAILAVQYKAFYRPEFFLPDLKRSMGLTQLMVLLGVMILARYYGIALSRNVWGMALGFAMFVALSVINLSAFEIVGAFTHYLQYAKPGSFVMMIAIWTWSCWEHTPAPMPSASGNAADEFLSEWKNAWHNTMARLRRILTP